MVPRTSLHKHCAHRSEGHTEITKHIRCKKVLHLASLDRHTPVANERERRKKGAMLRRVSDPGPYFWAPLDNCPPSLPSQWPTPPARMSGHIISDIGGCEALVAGERCACSALLPSHATPRQGLSGQAQPPTAPRLFPEPASQWPAFTLEVAQVHIWARISYPVGSAQEVPAVPVLM